MPRRPRAHVLEDESRRAFRAAIPAEWVPRDQTPDYGFDFQVQAFKDGQATPFFFFAQVKGSDKISPDTQAPTYRFKTSRLLHYLSCPFPTMLVLYDAQGKRLFYEWTHVVYGNLDEEQTKRWHTQESVSVRLAQRLDLVDASILLRDVRHQCYRMGQFRPDRDRFSIQLKFDTPTWGDVFKQTILDRLCYSRSSKHVTYTGSSAVDGTLLFTDEPPGVVIACAERGLDGFLIQNPGRPDQEEVLFLAQFGVALILAEAGCATASIDIIGNMFSDLEAVPDNLISLLNHTWSPKIYSSAGAIGDAISLAEDLAHQGCAHEATWVLMSTMYAGLSHDLHAARANRARELIAENARSHSEKAVAFYNLGNGLRASGEPRRAISAYRSAATADPTYLHRPYWWREAAGCLFGIGKLRWSEAAYRRSIELEVKQPLAHGLLGDVLLHQGRFAEAVSELEICLEQSDLPIAHFVLKHFFATLVTDRFGDVVSRNPPAAREITGSAEGLSRAERRAVTGEALRADPLCGFSWFNFAGSQPADTEGASHVEWLATAIAQDWDIEAWANAILAVFTDVFRGLAFPGALIFESMFYEAYRLHGNSIEHQVEMKLVETQGWTAESASQTAQHMSDLAQMAQFIFADGDTPEIRVLSLDDSTEGVADSSDIP